MTGMQKDELKSRLNDMWTKLQSQPPVPPVIVVAPVNYAVFEAYEKFADRDRRRIKREVRKATDKALAIARAQPTPSGSIDQASNPFWRRPSAH